MFGFLAAAAVQMSVVSVMWHYHDKSLRPVAIVCRILLLTPLESHFQLLLPGTYTDTQRRTQESVYESLPMHLILH